jgi:hypothetical protein
MQTGVRLTAISDGNGNVLCIGLSLFGQEYVLEDALEIHSCVDLKPARVGRGQLQVSLI